tara:strand:+ start:220 stop:1119 length:900 start_codon:yes stop_codon:yes gene_type:complete
MKEEEKKYIKKQFEIGDIKKAIKTALRISNKQKRFKSLIYIAEYQARDISIIKELRECDSIKYEQAVSSNFIHIAEKQIESGNQKGAKTTLLIAYYILKNIINEKKKINLLTLIAELLNKNGDSENVTEVFNMAVIATQDIKNIKNRCELLSHIAEKQAKTGDKKGAIKTFNTAIDAANNFNSLIIDKWGEVIGETDLFGYETSSILNTIAIAQSSVQLYKEASQTAKQIPDSAQRKWTYDQIEDDQGFDVWASKELTKELSERDHDLFTERIDRGFYIDDLLDEFVVLMENNDSKMQK